MQKRKKLIRLKNMLENMVICIFDTAWGSLLDSTDYLKQCLKDIYKITKDYEWKCLYTITDNHPKHFIGAEHRVDLEDFDIKKYIKNI